MMDGYDQRMGGAVARPGPRSAPDHLDSDFPSNFEPMASHFPSLPPRQRPV